jgi:hypothetical protein
MADNKVDDKAADDTADKGYTSPQVKAARKEPLAPPFGPGSRVNWDNPENDPNKRKHVGLDPEGKFNAKNSA